MGPRTRGKGKWGSTGPGFRPEKSSDGKKVPTGKSSDGKSSDGKSSDRKKFRPEKVPIGKKFRPGKSSDQEKVPTEKVPTGKKFRPGRKGKGIGQGRYIAILIK